MNLLPLQRLGPREASPGVVDFGLLLPWVSARDGNRLRIKIIHEEDQFLQRILPLVFELTHSVDPQYGDFWSAQVDVAGHSPPALGSAWGRPGRYVYRFELQSPLVHRPIDWIVDPFAREFGIGKLSAFTLGYEAHAWSATEEDWQTPELADLVLYELMITEFGGDIEGTIARLPYLADLGINAIEVMPVTNVSNTVDWGFLPIGYFGVDERFGKRRDFQRFVDAAHQNGIAIVLDAVYGHTSEHFPYAYVYRNLGYRENPFMGPFAADMFGESTDFRRELTRDFFLTVNHHWLDCYHVDGFRYDCVPNYWDGPTGDGYASLVYNTYRLVTDRAGAGGHWKRFHYGGTVHLIQCAEQLEAPRQVLEQTYSNCAWQNETLDAAKAVAKGDNWGIGTLGQRLGLLGYPGEVTVNQDSISKTALQYFENHDHSRFVCRFATLWRGEELLGEGDRNLWYKVQPYLIGLFTAKGIPLLWQGQEFGENYWVPDQGLGRVLLFRPVRWDYFYDPVGKAVISLVRRLAELRKQRQFRQGGHYFYNEPASLSRGVMLFSRDLGNAWSLVALNFRDADEWVPFAFPRGGRYREELHGQENLNGVSPGATWWLRVPSNYGRVWSWDGE